MSALSALSSSFAVAVLGGCAGTDRGSGGESGPPVVQGSRPTSADVGIETRLWTIDATLGPFLIDLGAEALYGEGPPAADRAAWREAGLRLIEVPADRIDEFEAIAPHAEAVRRVWLGQPTRWTPIASRDATEVERRSIPGSAGSTLQLLARSWIEPDVRRGPVFRVELALARTFRDGRGTPRPELMSGMLMSHTLEPGRALLLVPANPTEVWARRGPADEPGEGAEQLPEPMPEPMPEPVRDGAGGRDEELEVAGFRPPSTGTGQNADSEQANESPPDSPADSPSDSPIVGPALSTYETGLTIGESLLLRPARLTGSGPVPARRTAVAIVPNWPVLGKAP